MSTRLTFSHALNDMALRAKKDVWVSSDHYGLWETDLLQFFCQLMDTQIQPMLDYGAEVWGLDADCTPIDRIQMFAVKTFLNTSIRSPNLRLYDETGTHPIFMSTSALM